mmetsp:Transcript_10794/g.46746  ORF Transcript_10794/g.46746 Transcript_10794/m.46746 type:complete len:681 (+) Transcript_10794:36-2078(+)
MYHLRHRGVYNLKRRLARPGALLVGHASGVVAVVPREDIVRLVHLLRIVANLREALGSRGRREPDVRVAVGVENLAHVPVLNRNLEHVPIHVVDEHLNLPRELLDDVVVGVGILLGVERVHVRDANLGLLGGRARRVGVLEVSLVVVDNLDDARRLAVVAKTGGGDGRRLAARDEGARLRVLAGDVAVELHLDVRLDARRVAKLKAGAKLRLELGELVALEPAAVRVGGDDVGGGQLAAALLLGGEPASVANLHGVLLEIRHRGNGGGGTEVRAVLVVAVKRLELGLRRSPRLMRVFRLRRHEDADVVVVVGDVLRGVDPPVLLTLLGVAALDVVEGVKLDGERLAKAEGALLPLAKVVDGVGLLGVGVAKAVGGAADEAVGDGARVGIGAIPAFVGVVVNILLPGIVGDDKGKAVAAVADLVLAAALRRVGDLEDKVRLEAVPDVNLPVPPHCAGALRVGIARAACVAPLDVLAVLALLRLGEPHDPLGGVGAVEHDVGVADEAKVVLDALLLVRRGNETANVVGGLAAVFAREIGKVKLDVKSSAVLGRAHGLRVPVVAHDADDPFLAVGFIVVHGVLGESGVIRRGVTADVLAREDRLFERLRDAGKVVLVLVDGPRHGFSDGGEVVVRGVGPAAAVVVPAGVQVEVIVHGVHRDPQVVVGVIGLDVIVAKLLRLHD